MIKYLGSKRVLLDRIVGLISCVPDVKTVVDLFSGTARVGHALKKAGYRVISNDYSAYAQTLARCYVQADAEEWYRLAEVHLKDLQNLPGQAGYFTQTFCTDARFFTPENGARIDAIRCEIEARQLHPELESILLVSLMEAADRVDSTTGVQMAYLKQWAPRALNPLSLRMPAVLPQARAGKGEAHMMDALVAVESLSGDVAYIDPPYNQHSYLGNYHVWETLVRWDNPIAYGVARKREDTRTRGSIFNSKPRHAQAMREVIDRIDAAVLIVSFNNEGYLSREELTSMLSSRGEVLVLEYDFKRYVGAQIGVFNPAGERVGKVSHLRNKELIFVAGNSRLLSEVGKRRFEDPVQVSLL